MKIENKEPRLGHLQYLGRYYFWNATGLNIRSSFDQNVFICHIFLEYENNYFANYADNTKIRIADENSKEVLKNLSALANSNTRMAC